MLPHAVSVSLPTWQDNVDYEEGSPRVLNVMKTGYPRFFIHKAIQQLAAICEQKFGVAHEKAMVFPSETFAKACRDFITRMDTSASARIVQFFICPRDADRKPSTYSVPSCDLHIVLFNEAHWSHAKAFWQHTGSGISSRQGEYCLRLLEKKGPTTEKVQSDIASKSPIRCKNRHYYSRSISSAQMADDLAERLNAEETAYLEERYGRNMPAVAAKEAKETLRKRIAGVLVGEKSNCCFKRDQPLSSSIRGVSNITEDDVFLFPGGMCAIWHAHQLLLRTLGNRKSVCWGFPYVDTLKILQKWGPGCYFFGKGSEFDELETLLEELQSQSPPGSNEPPILALFCECTSNPLLQTPDLQRFRALADKYGFAIVVDETIGNYTNVEVLPYSDIWITTSLYNSLKTPQGGYGGLFSVTFTTPIAAKAFFDALGCEKGPSLGTNFTLACPFVILAHYTELDWVQQFNIDPYLVRVSVGLEKREVLLKWIEDAVLAAENAVLAGQKVEDGETIHDTMTCA
ncbi:hypothetical protein FRC19_008808 [Serendipita sp. 401]|nr:hypothetical protein FRC19_008808 [Serendipita sp. 401]